MPGRMRSAAQQQLRDVIDDAAEKKLPTSYVRQSAAVRVDVTDVTQPRHRGEPRTASKAHARRYSDIRLCSHTSPSTTKIVDSAASTNADGADGNKEFSVSVKQTLKSVTWSKLQETSVKARTRKLKKMSRKRPAHRQRKTTVKKSVASDPKTEVAATEEVHSGNVTTSDEPSTISAKTISSVIRRHRRIPKSRRLGKGPATSRCSNRDYQLETENLGRRNLIRKNNRLMRNKSAAKRNRRTRDEEIQKTAAKARAASMKEISMWAKNELLKRRDDEESNSTKSQADKISAVIHQTFVFESADKPIAVKVTSKNHHHRSAPTLHEEHSPQQEETAGRPTNGVPLERCRVEPRAKAATLCATEVHSRCSPKFADPADEDRQHPSRSISLPQKELQSVSSDSEEWLQMKRRQAAASRYQPDQAEYDLSRHIARLRTEAILAGNRGLDISLIISSEQQTTTYARVAETRPRYKRLSDNSNQMTTEGQQVTTDGDAEVNTEVLRLAAGPRNAKNTQALMQSLNISDSLPLRLPATANRSLSTFSTRMISSSRKQVGLPVSRMRTATTAREVTNDDLKVTSFITGGSLTVKKLHPHPMPKP